MAKETDKITKAGEGYNVVSAKAKNGTATFNQYSDLKTLAAKEKPEHIMTMFNRMTRVDAINTVNRPDATPSPVRALGKLAKTASDEVKAEIERKTLAIIAEAEKRIADLAKAESSK